jgi:hypothetical protein
LARARSAADVLELDLFWISRLLRPVVGAERGRVIAELVDDRGGEG